MEPLDSIIILLIACTLALFLLWLAGQVAHSKTIILLPDFIKTAYSSIWSYLTGAGLSSVLAVLRGNATRRPNYLVWSLGTASLLLALAFGTALAASFTLPSQEPPKLVLLKMRAKFDKQERPNLSFLQKQPQFREARSIGPDPLDGHYQEYVDWPAAKGQKLEAAAVQIAKTSAQVDGPDKKMQLCFTSNPTPPTNGPPLEVYMQCAEGIQCTFAPTDFGWAAECPKTLPESHSFFSLVTEANAQSREESVRKSGWRIPSLTTLQQMTDDMRPGYTEFTLKSESLSSVEKADSFRYQIIANGSPLYVDGWSPADMLRQFRASKGLDFSFGLENLSFSGADQGCENIGVALEFLSGSELIKRVQLTRRYAALRDAVTEQIKSGDGMGFNWTGIYVKPKNADRAEIFVISTPDLGEASRFKSRLDQAHLSYDAMDVVGVLRPPLNKPLYGVVIGLRQPTGQIKFTFDLASAKQMLAWAKDVHATSSKDLRHSPSIYQMKNDESGVGRMASCGMKVPQS